MRVNDGRGWIKLHREPFTDAIFNDHDVLAVYLYLLLNASYTDELVEGHQIKKGQTLTSFRKISADTGLSVRSVRTIIQKLEATHKTTHKSTHGFSIFSFDNQGLQQNNSKKATHKTTHKTTTLKEDKEECEGVADALPHTEEKRGENECEKHTNIIPQMTAEERWAKSRKRLQSKKQQTS